LAVETARAADAAGLDVRQARRADMGILRFMRCMLGNAQNADFDGDTFDGDTIRASIAGRKGRST